MKKQITQTLPCSNGNQNVWQLHKQLIQVVTWLLFGFIGHAQVSSYSFTQSNGTYTGITGGTAMVLPSTSTTPFDAQFFHNGSGGLNGTTTAGTYNAFPIGFNFVYDGQTFDGFYIGTDGWIKLGSTTGSLVGSAATTPISSTTANTNNIISAFGVDTRGCLGGVGNRVSGSNIITLTGTSTAVAPYLVPGMRILNSGIPNDTTILSINGNEITMSANAISSSTTAVTNFVEPDHISYLTTGTPGSRVLTVQYKNIQRWSAYGDLLNFQIKLYEGTNVIEMIYDTLATSTVSTSSTIQVGLKGTVSPLTFNNRLGTANDSWTTSTAGTASSSTLPFRGVLATLGAAVPASGLKFTWSPPTCILPTGINTTTLGPTTATLNWLASASNPSGGYDWELRTSGAAGSGATGLINSGNSTSLSTSISSLTELTVYNFYIRANCGGGDLSTWSSFTFSTTCTPPTIDTTTTGIRCGTGTVQLGATTTGTALNWYNTLTGGNSLGTGTSFTTPSISATTSYFVEASNVNTFSGQAKVANSLTSSTSGNDWGLMFTITKPIKINSVNVYLASATAGNMVVQLKNSAGTVLVSQTIAVPAGNATTPVLHTLNLTDFNVAPGTDYRLVTGTGSVAAVRETSGNTYPYPLGNAGNITSGYITGPTATTYYWFYNWNIDIVCASPRTEVVATVSVPPAFALSASNDTICKGQSSDLVTITTGAGDYNTYAWLPTAGVSGDETMGWTFNPTTTTTYTLTASQSGGALCSTNASFVVTVNPVPTPLAITSPAEVCANSIQQLSPTGGTIGSNVTATVGTATTATSSTTQPTAFCNRWKHYWVQMVYTKAELNALGIVAGNISAIKFNITTLGDGTSVSDFIVRIGTTSNSTLSTFTSSGLTQVFSTPTYTHAVGENTITFDTPYNWDGESNLIIDMRQTGADVTNNAQTLFTATTGNTVVSAVTSTTSTSDGFAATNPAATTSVNRLNTTFVWSNVQSTAISWSPTTNLYTDAAATLAYTGGAAPTVYFKSANVGSSTYTITATTALNCTASTSVTVNTTPPTVTPMFTAIEPIYSGANLAPLPTTSNNGITGVWSPTLNNTATTVYTFTPTDGQCAATTTLEIVVDTATVSIRPVHCGAVLPELGTNIFVVTQPNIQEYSFEIRNNTTNAIVNYITTNRFFNLVLANVNPTFGTSYNVRVKVKRAGVYGVFGPICTVTTPSLPGPTLRADFCNLTLPAMGSNIYAVTVSTAQEYTFEVTKPNNTIVEVVRPGRFFNLINGGIAPTPATTYSVRVKVKLGGVYGSYGAACTVTTPGPSTTVSRENSSTSNLFEVNAFPNPFKDSFTLQIPASELPTYISVMDMTGKQVINATLSAYESEIQNFGSSLASGIYLVSIAQGEEIKSLKVVKQ